MDPLSNILLAIIQGLTEYLPVSSSGHLELAKVWLGVDLEGKQALIYTTVLHLGTAMSTLFVYRTDIWDLLKNLSKGEKESLSFSMKIVVSLIPAGLVGLLLEQQIEALFNGNLLLVGLMLWLTSGLLFSTNLKVSVSHQTPTWLMALAMGLMQAIAILPGVSRSGSTISLGIHTRVSRPTISRFSFLMVLPLILGKVLLDTVKMIKDPSLMGELSWVQLGLGLVVSFVIGVFACRWMIKLVNTGSLKYFALYCLVVGTIAVFFTI